MFRANSLVFPVTVKEVDAEPGEKLSTEFAMENLGIWGDLELVPGERLFFLFEKGWMSSRCRPRTQHVLGASQSIMNPLFHFESCFDNHSVLVGLFK
jgi:hypothetical protein